MVPQFALEVGTRSTQGRLRTMTWRLYKYDNINAVWVLSDSCSYFWRNTSRPRTSAAGRAYFGSYSEMINGLCLRCEAASSSLIERNSLLIRAVGGRREVDWWLYKTRQLCNATSRRIYTDTWIVETWCVCCPSSDRPSRNTKRLYHADFITLINNARSNVLIRPIEAPVTSLV